MNLLRINAADVSIGGKKVRIEIVRDSAICRFFTKKEFIVIFNTLYVRDVRLTRKVLMTGIADVMLRHKIGFIKYYWNLLTMNEK